ncbi:unnamed protein product [Brachionus calyciflorus]|uniref:SAM domain-containing protein n=1 Tax=Brachionus calyciflorus TaxID=104777 RepID=A0A813MLR2_9BILA|nr:unnamed protein product [Brachionus calyciflorus]
MKLEVFNESANTSTSGHFSDIEFMTNSFKNEPYSSQSDLETKFKSNRKSIYDNHRMSLFKDDSCDSSELEYSSNFQDHEIKNKNSQKIDRDDFDDLIDLTHRVPRKFMKKTQNIKKIPKPSSLPPLPPLPYSFVKLERSKADSNLCLKIDDNKKSRKSVTRLIMPIQSKPNESSTQKKFEPDKIRQSDVIQEWDQISKIFASLETLLNDVVQTSTIKTCNDSVNSIKTGSENFQRGKSSQSHRAMSEHNLKKCDQMNSISFNSINRSNTNKTKYLKKLLNDSFGKNDEVDSCQIGKSSFHLNMKKFKYFELSEYLGKLNLSKYEFKFLTNGYDDLAFLNNVLTLQDLIQIGIEDYNDIFTILNEVKKLPSKIRRIANESIQFNSVSEWLNYLNLNEYLSNFTDNNVINMEMAKSLWEIELSTVRISIFLSE